MAGGGEGGGGGATLLLLLKLVLLSRQAAPHGRRLALVERVRQGREEGVGAGGAQRDGAGRPHRGRQLLRQGRRRGGELRDGREEGRAGEGGGWGETGW